MPAAARAVAGEGDSRKEENDGEQEEKRYGIVAALLLLVLAAGVGTYAWLTAQSSLTNNFTTAGINKPTTDPDKPGQPIPTDPDKVNGNLTETKWVKDSKLAPGVSVAKNPNVGIGKGSEDAYVYVFVNNKTAPAGTDDSKTTYFTINSGWQAVDASTVAGEPTHYLGGLFVYIGGGTEATPLIASKTEDKWTGELFSQVTTPKETEQRDFANPATMVSTASFTRQTGPLRVRLRLPWLLPGIGLTA